MAYPWQKIRPLLDEALELPVAERREFVERACEDPELRGQVVSILRAYDDETCFLDRPLVDLREHLGDRQPGDRIGSYELIERLGEGGMGTVYLASRADDSFSKQVAIKLLRQAFGSEEWIRRFRHERQILASLEHPHIAKLLDGGSTEEGFPYLVMEYVDGEPIDVYCENKALTIGERLELFVKVCRAVQFAHQNFVVHRDLKPSNILVDAQGEPRLLDFGIAKSLAPEAFPETVVATRTGFTPMTPEYASPEQVQGRPITTASDVYSLGVLLFRLLAGTMPYTFDGRDLNAVVDAICHQDVPRPSSRLQSTGAGDSAGKDTEAVRRALRGDLDAIVLKALCKEPASRYATAAQLVADIERHFADRPVRARHDTLIYRTSRFLRRHRIGLTAAAVVVLVVLSSFIALLLQQQRVVEERNRAVLERNRAATVSSWLIELFELPDPGRSLGERVTARELLDKSRASVRLELAGQPDLQVVLLATLGRTYAQLGLLPEARTLLTDSIALQRRLPGGSSPRLASSLHQLAEILALQGDYQAAQKVAREALLRVEHPSPNDAASPVAGPSGGERLAVEGLLAHIEARLGHYDEAARLFDSAMQVPTSDLEERATVLGMQADFERERGDSQRSRQIFEQALALRRQLHGAGHPEIALLESSLAAVLRAEEPERAESLFRDAVERQRRLYEGAHPVLATAINNLALHLYDDERFDEAEILFRESLAMKHELYGDSHPKIAATLNNLGNLARRRGLPDEAEGAYRKALEIYAREFGEGHPEYAFGLSNLGGLEMSRGDLDAARSLLSRSLEIIESSLGEGHPKTAPITNNLGEVARRQGDLESARTYFQRAIAAAYRDPGERRHNLPIALFNLAVLLGDTGELQEAAGAYAEILELTSEDRSLALFARTRLAWSLLRLGDLDGAAAHAREALDGWRRRDGGRGSWGLSAQRTLGLALLRLGRLDDAEALLRDRQHALAASSEASERQRAQAREDLLELEQARGLGAVSP